MKLRFMDHINKTRRDDKVRKFEDLELLVGDEWIEIVEVEPGVLQVRSNQNTIIVDKSASNTAELYFVGHGWKTKLGGE